MPPQYEKIRDNLVKQGKSLKAAKSEAAAIYNTTHKDDPVTGKSDAMKRGGMVTPKSNLKSGKKR